MRTIFRILLAVTLFTLVVSAHECGHWIGAALVGIPIKEFSVGFGPALWHTVIRGVQFSVRALPLGGFVMPDPAAVAAATPGAVFIMTAAGPICGFAATMLVALAFARKSLQQLFATFALNALVVYAYALAPVLMVVFAIRNFRKRHVPPAPVAAVDTEEKKDQGSSIMGPIGIMKGFATGNLVFILSVSAAINGLNLSPVPFFDGNRLAMLLLYMLGCSPRNAMLIPLFLCGSAIGYVLSKKLLK